MADGYRERILQSNSIFYRPSFDVREEIKRLEKRLAHLRQILAYVERQEDIWAEEEHL